jgi:hypothetical protein
MLCSLDRPKPAKSGRSDSGKENTIDWRKFLEISSNHLALKPCGASSNWSWCSWTTFERLGEDAGYWTASLPLEAELLSESTSDGGRWGQPFHYSQLAHVIIPRRFYWEQISGGFKCGFHQQDVAGLSKRLTAEGILHRLTEHVLEVKLY